MVGIATSGGLGYATKQQLASFVWPKFVSTLQAMILLTLAVDIVSARLSAVGYFFTTVVSEAFPVLAGASVVLAAAIVVSDAFAGFAAIVVSVADVAFFGVVALIRIRVHVRLPLTVLQTSLVLAFGLVAAEAALVPIVALSSNTTAAAA